VVYPPIPVDDWTHDNLTDRIAEVRQLYLDTLKDWPHGDVPRPGLYTRKRAPAKKTAKKAPAKTTPAKTTAKKSADKPPAKKAAAKKTTKKTAAKGRP
jgi:putative phosphoserine phosphatase/1-acylglycerol-3-phosphate O-acyltransferase